jgi:hypothetical protein
MFSFIRSHRSALVCLAGLACLALLLLLAVVGLFLAAFPAAAQNSTTAGPNSAPTYQSLRNLTLSSESAASAIK